MSMGEDEERKYDLLGSDIIPKLTDRRFFIDAVIHNYALVAHSVGLMPICSNRRAGEAYEYWQADVNRTLNNGIDKGTTELDHFKNASFIAFWLRRMIPINEVRIISPQGTDTSERRHERRVRYFKYGNELSAFLIGYKICINYEAQKIYGNSETVKPFAKRVDYIRSLDLGDDLMSDYLMLWKHKNMSPYAFYLMYKSLFTSAQSSR